MVNKINDFFFGSNGQTIVPLVPVTITSRQQAFRTAAWLKAMAFSIPDDGSNATYEEIEQAINNS
jgi:hypothetical protein